MFFMRCYNVTGEGFTFCAGVSSYLSIRIVLFELICAFKAVLGEVFGVGGLGRCGRRVLRHDLLRSTFMILIVCMGLVARSSNTQNLRLAFHPLFLGYPSILFLMAESGAGSPRDNEILARTDDDVARTFEGAGGGSRPRQPRKAGG